MVRRQLIQTQFLLLVLFSQPLQLLAESVYFFVQFVLLLVKESLLVLPIQLVLLLILLHSRQQTVVLERYLLPLTLRQVVLLSLLLQLLLQRRLPELNSLLVC